MESRASQIKGARLDSTYSKISFVHSGHRDHDFRPEEGELDGHPRL